MDDLLPYQATADAPGDSLVKQRDHEIERPFDAAQAVALTTFIMNPWIPGHRRRELAEKGGPSSKSSEDVSDDGGMGGE
jgi:hypothetical protein